ncbi:AraC family transcriptional regulator [Paenibacillus sp. An7]|uniref:AraC family transcriptional regulator n=1 Tax=Paenibacillus sp. An7 TaxID=2689577 RepID=UPI0013585ACE|nr:GyrI-like domain-containing protein [Paenibacillus sp. An7]
MKFDIETLPSVRIAYVRQIGPYGSGNIRVMQRLKEWAKEENLLTESAVLFGISQDNPETVPPEQCRYDACIVIPQDYQMNKIISESKLPCGDYAIFKLKHTAEDIQKAWNQIFPAIQNGGYLMDNKPVIERYKGHMILDDDCEICVPVKTDIN